MSVDSDAFKSWASAFEKRKSFFFDLKFENDDGDCPRLVADVLGDKALLDTKLAPELLKRNLLYACFQAEHAMTLGADSTHKLRQEFSTGYSTLGELESSLFAFTDLLDKHPEVIIAALRYLDGPLNKADRPAWRYEPNLDPLATLAVLKPAIKKIARSYRLSANNKDPNFTDSTLDCRAGPFMFYNRKENRGHSSGTPRSYGGLVEDGLLFHLTYLFRFFTGGTGVTPIPLKLDANDVVVVEGPMIKKGSPHAEIVSFLFNATFRKRYQEAINGRDVADRLKSLSKQSKSGNVTKDFDKTMNPKRPDYLWNCLEFVGWPPVE
jgi:hypothetical protein